MRRAVNCVAGSAPVPGVEWVAPEETVRLTTIDTKISEIGDHVDEIYLRLVEFLDIHPDLEQVFIPYRTASMTERFTGNRLNIDPRTSGLYRPEAK